MKPMKKLLNDHPQYWYVSSKGFVENGCNAKPNKTELRKKFGNYFKTQRIAYLALERMTGLFIRLKK